MSNHAVENGLIQHLSVSQIGTFRLCKRKWRLEKVERLPKKPPSKAIQIGVDGHSRLEQFFKYGKDVLGPLEKLGISFLPKPGPGLLVEHPIHAPDAPRLFAGNIPMQGFIDLLDPRDPRIVKIYDHKFKGDITAYGTREGDLINPEKDSGTQMLAYAAWARKAYPSHKLAVLQHNQFQTRGVRAFVPVREEINLDAARGLWEDLSGKVAVEMAQAAAASSWTNVEGNLSACKAFGGCDYLNICHDPLERFAVSIYRGSKNEVPEAARMNFFTVTVPTSSPTQVSEVSLPKTIPVEDLGIVPPDSPRRMETSPAAEPQPSAANVAIETEPVAALGEGLSSPVEPKRRGRPPKVRTEPLGTTPQGKLSGEAFAEAARQKFQLAMHEARIAPVMAVPEDRRVRLYINCAPVGVAGQDLFPYVLKLEKQILEQTQVVMEVPDLRLASDQVLGYGRWKAILEAAIKISDIPAGLYVVSTRDERVLVVAEALARMLPKGEVTRGLM